MLFFVNLRLDESRPEDTLRLEAIMSAAHGSKEPLLVTTIDRKGPLVLNLESRSGATPRPVFGTKFALEVCSLEDALAYHGGNVSGLRFFILPKSLRIEHLFLTFLDTACADIAGT